VSSTNGIATRFPVIDEYRRDAIRKLEALRRASYDKQALAQNVDVSSHLTD
jgi:hypothetical protein